MLNEFFAKMESLMATAQAQTNELRTTTLCAQETCQQFIDACDKALATEDELLAQKLTVDSELNTGNLWDEVIALREAAKKSVEEFDRKLCMLNAFAD